MWSVHPSVCHSSEPCQNAEPIYMPFVFWVQVYSRNHVLDRDGNPDLPMGRGIFEGEGQPIVKYRGTLRGAVQKRMNQLRCCYCCGLGWAH